MSTSSLLLCDMVEAEDGEEAFLVLQLRAVVHVLWGKAGYQGDRSWPLALNSWWGGTPLSQHAPPLPSLYLHHLLPTGQSGQVKHLQKLYLLLEERYIDQEILLLLHLRLCETLWNPQRTKNIHKEKYLQAVLW